MVSNKLYTSLKIVGVLRAAVKLGVVTKNTFFETFVHCLKIFVPFTPTTQPAAKLKNSRRA